MTTSNPQIPDRGDQQAREQSGHPVPAHTKRDFALWQQELIGAPPSAPQALPTYPLEACRGLVFGIGSSLVFWALAALVFWWSLRIL